MQVNCNKQIIFCQEISYIFDAWFLCEEEIRDVCCWRMRESTVRWGNSRSMPMIKAENSVGANAAHTDWPKPRTATNSLLRFHDEKHSIAPANMAKGKIISMTAGKFNSAIFKKLISGGEDVKTLTRRTSSTVWIRLIIEARPRRQSMIQPTKRKAK